MLKVAVVILNWNTKGQLERFLPLVLKNTKEENVETIVADNGSIDDSLEFLRKEHPDVRVISLDKNYGFAEGYNRALQQIKAEYFVLLNSDIEVTPGWLRPLLREIEGDPLIAACMPKVKALDLPDHFEYAGAAGGFIDRFGYAFCRGRIFDILESDYGQYDKVLPVFWTTGACMIIRGPLYKIAGGLDPHFFAHFEEIDLCWRLKNRGYKFLCVPESTVFHVGGGTLPSTSPWKTFLNYRNNLLMLYKNLPSGKLGNVIMKRFLMDWLSAFRLLLRGKPGSFLAIFRAHFAFTFQYKQYKKFRKEEKRFITHTEHDEIYPGSLVQDYFIRKKYTFRMLKWK